MINRLLVFIVLVPITILAQSDTIFTSDTTISSVRVINMSDNLLRYFYIDSNKKKHMLYSFMFSFNVELQLSKQHTGIKKVVRSSIKRLNPSIPKVIL